MFLCRQHIFMAILWTASSQTSTHEEEKITSTKLKILCMANMQMNQSGNTVSMGKLANFLHDLGNNVTIMLPEHSGSLSVLHSGVNRLLAKVPAQEPSRDKYASFYKVANEVIERTVSICELILSDRDLLDQLREESYEFVVFTFDPCTLIIAEYLDVPSMEYLTPGLFIHPEASLFMNYIPAWQMSNVTPPLDLKERIVNTLLQLAQELVKSYILDTQLDEIKRRHWVLHSKSMQVIRAKQHVKIVNSHALVDYTAPIPPLTYLTGGAFYDINIKPDDHIQKFIDRHTNSEIIVMALGNFEADNIDTVWNMFAEAFKALTDNHIIIWKLKSPDGIRAVHSTPGNYFTKIFITPWMDQLAVLSHPNVKLFITHGGLGECWDAIYYGVPVIGMSMQNNDQAWQVNRMVDYLHMGESLDIEVLKASSHALGSAIISKRIQSVLRDKTYRENAQKYSQLIRTDRPTPEEKTIGAMNLAVEFKNSPHLIPKISRFNWWENVHLDVAAVILVSMFLPSLIILKILMYITPPLLRWVFKSVSMTTAVTLGFTVILAYQASGVLPWSIIAWTVTGSFLIMRLSRGSLLDATIIVIYSIAWLSIGFTQQIVHLGYAALPLLVFLTSLYGILSIAKHTRRKIERFRSIEWIVS